jgi:hypothetical protein
VDDVLCENSADVQDLMYDFIFFDVYRSDAVEWNAEPGAESGYS